jgi:hypothetical protein
MRISPPLLALMAVMVAGGCSREPGTPSDPPGNKGESTESKTVVPTPLPQELVGTWASPGAKFRGNLLVEGGVIYLCTDGLTCVVGAPPPIGVLGTATYDSEASTLVLDLNDNGVPPERLKMTVAYNPTKGTLTTIASDDVTEATFSRHRSEMPKWVLNAMKDRGTPE